MDASEQAVLDWVAGQSSVMIAQTEQWASINSGSYNPEGLDRMRGALEKDFTVLGGAVQIFPLDPLHQIDEKGREISVTMTEALSITKHPKAKIQVLLVGHMDTVYGPEHAFQTCRRLGGDRLNGPGVADLKGGLSVMLHALAALERSPWAGQIGWQVLLNPDEEIGSISSDPWLKRAAAGKQLGLVYEPALADGSLAGARKGSGNFTLVVAGRAAHAGRNPEDGRNAIVALAALTQSVFALNGQRPGLTVNPGKITGGGALNTVPDQAILRFNVRIQEAEDATFVQQKLKEIIESLRLRNGFSAVLHGQFTRAPKPMHPSNRAVFDAVLACASDLGLTIGIQPSGGCCDGNNLWRHGLPNVDTLGVRGEAIHSPEEVAYLDSFVERAQLSALLLTRLARGALVIARD